MLLQQKFGAETLQALSRPLPQLRSSVPPVVNSASPSEPRTAETKAQIATADHSHVTPPRSRLTGAAEPNPSQAALTEASSALITKPTEAIRVPHDESDTHPVPTKSGEQPKLEPQPQIIAAVPPPPRINTSPAVSNSAEEPAALPLPEQSSPKVSKLNDRTEQSPESSNFGIADASESQEGESKIDGSLASDLLNIMNSFGF
ncbi:hypothetical protein DFJ73DRAFT_808766 [Zopfochytrium polystomum]|nr:hypothetical protein DFJ73DRAFT_808766 [Zopfochytrium polystomum]